MSQAEQDSRNKLRSVFEDQLRISVNFRIHRLELMRFCQKSNETRDEFANRCREKAGQCDFEPSELDERVVELVIASTPLDPFRHILLQKPRGYKIEALLEEGRRHEAVAASDQCLQTLSSDANQSKPALARVDAVTSAQRTCGNCGLSHKPRRCPAYRDTYKFCENKGHWAKLCRKSKAKGRRRAPSKSPNRRRRQTRSTSRSANRNRSNAYSGPKGKTSNDREEHHYFEDECTDDVPVEAFNYITVSDMCTTATQRKNKAEAYTTLVVVCPDPLGRHHLQVKVDTGASANTFPVRTMRQIYGDQWRNQTSPTETKLKEYNGSNITCNGYVHHVQISY